MNDVDNIIESRNKMEALAEHLGVVIETKQHHYYIQTLRLARSQSPKMIGNNFGFIKLLQDIVSSPLSNGLLEWDTAGEKWSYLLWTLLRIPGNVAVVSVIHTSNRWIQFVIVIV